ncbi:hypothetical protein [Streptacidiphilus albus]|uniref:hypothetical protein n=1 Tax=Streptacidiphilus albus TaxID=105425 RepID=UPI000690CFC4|nr:hypothetical protein [Streptacidiphilus albus]
MAGKARTAALAASVVLGAVLPMTAAAPANAAAVTCANGSWLAQYYANTWLGGTARKTRCEGASLNYNWGAGHPAGIALSNGHFSARWTMKRDFGGGGPIAFNVSGEDGLRLYVDGVRRVNLWSDVKRDHGAGFTLNLTPGVHTVQLDYSVYQGRADVRLGYAPAAYDTVAPNAVAGFKAAHFPEEADNRVGLSWTPNVEMDLAGYRIYRGTQSWNAYAPANLVATLSPLARSWVDASGAFTYAPNSSYAIVAYDTSGNVSPVTPALLKPVNYTPPGAPNHFQLFGYSGNETIDWDGAGSGEYDVYRSTSPNGPFTLLASTDMAGYTDASGSPTVAYYYRVDETDIYRNTSPLSAVVGPTAIETP